MWCVSWCAFWPLVYNLNVSFFNLCGVNSSELTELIACYFFKWRGLCSLRDLRKSLYICILCYLNQMHYQVLKFGRADVMSVSSSNQNHIFMRTLTVKMLSASDFIKWWVVFSWCLAGNLFLNDWCQGWPPEWNKEFLQYTASSPWYRTELGCCRQV